MKAVNTNAASRLRPMFLPNIPHEDLGWSLFCSSDRTGNPDTAPTGNQYKEIRKSVQK